MTAWLNKAQENKYETLAGPREGRSTEHVAGKRYAAGVLVALAYSFRVDFECNYLLLL
jgi:hypothetical protein